MVRHTINCKTHGNTGAYLVPNRGFRCSKCNSSAVQRRRRKIKQMAIEYKGGECFYCGYKKSLSALQFHHVNPKKKDFAIGAVKQSKSWETIKKELDKCLLVCANCHFELHELHELHCGVLQSAEGSTVNAVVAGSRPAPTANAATARSIRASSAI